MPTLTSQLVVRLLDGVTKPAQAAARAIRGIGLAARDANGFTLGDRIVVSAQRANARVGQLHGQMVEAVAAGWALERAIQAPIAAAVAFESQMADVRKVVDFPTPEAFAKMGQDIRAMSLRIPMASQGLASIVAAAGQAGIAGQDLLPFTEMAAKVGVAFDISAEQAGDALAKLRTGLGMTNPQVGLLADAMNALSNAQASSASDILDVVRRVGADGKQFGFTAVQTAAFASAMLSAGAESEVAATSFRNMGLALTHGSAATKGQRKAFAALGLDATKVAKGMQKNAVQTTLDVIQKLGKLPAYQRAAISSELFGNEARALGPLLTQLDLVRSSLGMVTRETDYAGSAQREFDVRSQTTANSLQLFRNRLTNLGISVGQALIPPLNNIMAAIGPVVDRISDWAAANPRLTATIVEAGAALIGFRVAVLATRFAAAFGKAGILDMAAGFVLVGRGTGRAVVGLLGLLNPLALVRNAMMLLKVAVIGTGIGAALVGIGLAGAWIYENWSGISTAFTAFGGAFTRAVQPVMPMLQPVINGVSTLFAWVEQIVGPVDEMGSGWVNFGLKAGKAVGDLVVSVTQTGAAILAEVATWPERFMSFLAGLPSRLVEMFNGIEIQDPFPALGQRMVTEVGAWPGQIIGILADLPSRIIALFSGIDLTAAGIAMITSLWNGMMSKLTEMGAAIREKISGMFSGISLPSISLPSPSAAPTPSMLARNPRAAATMAPSGARAYGGRVEANSSYLVGEKRPELFTPGQTGWITPMDRLPKPIERGRGGGAGRGGGQHVFAPKISITQQPGENGEALAQRVMAMIKREFEDATRASLSDVGVG